MAAPHQFDSDMAEEVGWRLVPHHADDPEYCIAPSQALHLGRSRRLPKACQWDDPRVSGLHCTFQADESGELIVVDRSMNGVFVNGRKIGKGRAMKLVHGDRVDLTHSDPLDGASAPPITYAVHWDAPAAMPAVEEVVVPDIKSPAVEDTVAVDAASAAPEEVMVANAAVEPETVGVVVEHSCHACYSLSNQPDALCMPGPMPEGGLAASTSSVPSLKPFRDGASEEDTDAMAPRRKRTKRTATASMAGPLMKRMEDSLSCGICHQVFHDPVLCVPCMHNFCAGCFSQWMVSCSECPRCRVNVVEVRRNHAVRSMAEEYLLVRPELRRSPMDLAELDAKNVVTTETLRVKRVALEDVFIQSAKGREDELDDLQSDATELEFERPPLGPWSTAGESPWGGVRLVPLFGSGTLAFAGQCSACSRPDRHQFRCPPAEAPHHTCTACHQLFPVNPVSGVHVQCGRCSAFYCGNYWDCFSVVGSGALRRLRDHEMTKLPANALGGNAFELEVLQDYLAHRSRSVAKVWTQCLDRLPAWRVACSDVGWAAHAAATTIAEKGDKLAEEPMPSLIDLDGTEEIVAELMEDEAPPATPAEVGVEKEARPHTIGLDAEVAPLPPFLTADHVCCQSCAEEVFAVLIFLYRLDLPSAKLPIAIRGRPYCWYGKDCHLQRYDEAHCRQYNHACFSVQ
eukprot:GGOE01020399.1.p1 GENE.GGOE01020399.1~~GGOE01020399.1.p1  ORF type:complete len:692 (+),score=171.69 GGOE01020399.1:25-2076(+)